MSESVSPYVVTLTDAPDSDPLAALPDDERRLVLAWRRVRTQANGGDCALAAVKIGTHLYLFDKGAPGGKVLLRGT